MDDYYIDPGAIATEALMPPVTRNFTGQLGYPMKGPPAKIGPRAYHGIILQANHMLDASPGGASGHPVIFGILGTLGPTPSRPNILKAIGQLSAPANSGGPHDTTLAMQIIALLRTIPGLGMGVGF